MANPARSPSPSWLRFALPGGYSPSQGARRSSTATAPLSLAPHPPLTPSTASAAQRNGAPSTQPGARRKSQPPSAAGSDDPPRSSSSPLLRPSSAVSSFPHITPSAGPSPLPQGSSSRDDIEAPVVSSRKGPFFRFASFLGAHKIVTCRVHDPLARTKALTPSPGKTLVILFSSSELGLLVTFQLHPPRAGQLSLSSAENSAYEASLSPSHTAHHVPWPISPEKTVSV